MRPIKNDFAITPQGVEEEYGIPVATQCTARQQGKFAPYFRVGRRIYYRRTAVAQWICEQEQKSQQKTGSRE